MQDASQLTTDTGSRRRPQKVLLLRVEFRANGGAEMPGDITHRVAVSRAARSGASTRVEREARVTIPCLTPGTRGENRPARRAKPSSKLQSETPSPPSLPAPCL